MRPATRNIMAETIIGIAIKHISRANLATDFAPVQNHPAGQNNSDLASVPATNSLAMPLPESFNFLVGTNSPFKPLADHGTGLVVERDGRIFVVHRKHSSAQPDP